jgi:hypothetical protein
VTFVATERAYACSCAVGEPIARYNAADAVFVGTVRSVTDPEATTSTLADGTSVKGPSTLHIEIDVDTAYKGVDTGPATVRTSNQEPNCGFTFAVDERYLVYATQGDQGLVTDLCSGNVVASQATLPPPGAASNRPVAPPSTLPRTGLAAGSPTLAVSVGLLGVGLVCVFLAARRRRTASGLRRT